jgi:hypothetical protein
MKMFELNAQDPDGNISLLNGTTTIRLYADSIEDAYQKLLCDYELLQDDFEYNEIREVSKKVGYARYSSETQRQFPQLSGWMMDEKFEDVGGTEEFSRMLDILNEGDLVLINNWCRLSRDLKVQNDRVSEILSRGCDLFITSTCDRITPPHCDQLDRPIAL